MNETCGFITYLRRLLQPTKRDLITVAMQLGCSYDTFGIRTVLLSSALVDNRAKPILLLDLESLSSVVVEAIVFVNHKSIAFLSTILR